jgi:hypothetical protein
MLQSRLSCAMVALALSANAFSVEPPISPGSRSIRAGSPELAEQWWQWAMSASEANSPVADRTGANCAVGQGGDTWFLAGGYGSSTIRRSCTVPKGKLLFFPLVNMVYWQSRRATTFTCERAKVLAALNNETALDLFAEIDGTALDNLSRYRVTSKACFDVFARASSSQGAYNAYPSATDGYWLLMEPLSPGRHVLKFGGRYNRNSVDYGRMVQDIEYILLVE